MKEQKKVAVFTGTRADYGLLYWLLKDIQADSELSLQLIVSGMHLSPEFGLTYREIENDGFSIDEKIENLLSSDTPVGVAKSVGLGVIGMADALSRLLPDVLVILGDRFEALAAAQSAMFLRIPILHLHGGEVTEGAYDDAIRHAISKLSYLHGVSTEAYRQRVIQLGEKPERVVNVGAVGLEFIKRQELLSLHRLSESLKFELDVPFFVVTYHPATLGDESPTLTLRAILDALAEFPEYKVILTYPNADDGGRDLISMIKDFAQSNSSRVLLQPSLGQLRYLSAVKHCAAVIGNSSSGIIEAPTLKVPTIDVGVRQKGRIAAKSVVRVNSDKTSIVDGLNRVISKEFSEVISRSVNPYDQGLSTGKIIDMIKNQKHSSIKEFYDIPYLSRD